MLDIENRDDAVEWLLRHGFAAPPDFEVLAGGVSSRTVRVGDIVLKQSLPKLRVAVDWFSSPDRIHREALAMRHLARIAPPGSITDLLFNDTDEHVIAMSAVPRPHSNWKTMLLSGDVRLEHVHQFGALLRAIHSNSAGLREVFADKSFFETLRVEPYYRYTAHHAPAFFGRLIEETLATNTALVHGDYSPKNVLIHDDRLVLLDHEVAHFGDPAFDIGFAMAHFLSKAHHLAPSRERFLEAAQEFWRTYGDDSAEARCVRHSLACLLARVLGRSPLEYLTADERARQAEAVLAIMVHPPAGMPEMIERFAKEIACR